MRYYKLIFSYENDERYPLAKPSRELTNRFIIYKGNVINDWESVQFEYDTQDLSGINESLGNSYHWPVLSQDVIKLFGEIIREDVQLLPVQAVSKENGDEIGTYSVLNILRLFDALDLKHSIHFYHGKSEEYLSVVEYALKKDQIGKNHIFRLNKPSDPIFVSEKFREIAKKNKIKSFGFAKVKMV